MTRWQVSQCECGHLTLQLGTMRIEFTRAEFAQLERLVVEARKRFGVESSDVEVFSVGPLTH